MQRVQKKNAGTRDGSSEVHDGRCKMKRMLHRQVSMAFEKWQYEAAEMARSRYMMGDAVKCLMNKKPSDAAPVGIGGSGDVTIPECEDVCCMEPVEVMGC